MTDDIVLASMMVSVTQILTIIFILFLTLKKYYSWIFLFCAQTNWFIYSLYIGKFDIIAVIVIGLSLFALGYSWNRSIFGFSSRKERSIFMGITIIAIGLCFMSPGYIILQVNEILFQVLTFEGMVFLAFKTIDGWVLLMMANLFYWQNTVQDTIAVIILGTLVYGFGMYNWKKELT